MSLDDSALYSARVKHAKVVFSSSSGYTTNVTLEGTDTAVYHLGPYSAKVKSTDDDKTPVYKTTGFIVGMAVGGAVLICVAVCCIK